MTTFGIGFVIPAFNVVAYTLVDGGMTLSNLINNNLIPNAFCATQYVISAPPIPASYSYTIGSTAITIEILDFTIATSDTCSDLVWVYDGYQMSGAVEITLPIFITLTDKTFTVVTSDDSKVGPWEIKLKVTLPNG